MASDYEFFTVVFKGDMRKFKGNPFKITDTPFGEPIACGLGDAFTEIESLKIIIDETDPFNRAQVEAICRAVCKVEGLDPDGDCYGDNCDANWTRYADAVASAVSPAERS